MNRTVCSFGIFISFLICILLIIPLFIDANQYKGKIIAEAQEALGKELKLEGPITLALLPSPAVTLHQVKLANHPKAKTPYIATLEKIKISLSIIPLIKRRLHISKVEVLNPKIELEKLAKGSMNWEADPHQNPSSINKAESPFTFDTTVDEIRIINAHISYRDDKDLLLMKGINLQAGMTSFKGPYIAKVNFRLSNQRVDLKLNLGELRDDQTVVAQIDFARSRFILNGSYQYVEQFFKGKCWGQLYPKMFRTLVPQASIPPALNQKISFSSILTANNKEIAVKNLFFNLQKLILGSELSVSLEKNIIAKAKLQDLPGRGVVNFSLEPHSQGIAGTANFEFQELHTFLKWLNISTNKNYIHLLERCKFSTKFSFLEDFIKLSKIDLSLNEALLSGDIHYKLNQTVPTVMINLKTPKIENFLPLDHKQSKNPIGIGSAQGHLKGDSKSLHFDLSMTLGNLSFITKGQASALDEIPHLNIEFDGKTSNLNSFLRAFGLKPKISSLAASLKSQVTGYLNQLNVNIKATLGGLALTAAGMVKNVATVPAFNFSIDCSHPNFRNFLSIFNIFPHTAQGNVAFTTNINGDIQYFKIENIKGTLGTKNDFTGIIEINCRNTIPMIIGSLTSHSFSLDPFITQATKAQKQEEPDSFFSFLLSETKPSLNHTWSREPINFDLLKEFEADINFTVEKMNHKDIAIENLHFLTKLQDGTLDISPVTGNLYGGKLDANFQLNSQTTFDGKLELTQANLSKLIPSGDSFKIVGGKFSLDVALKTKGGNLHAMIARLEGPIKMRAQDGVINGFDLKALSRRLKEINSIPSLLSLLTDSMSKGKTSFHEFKSDIMFKNGIGTINSLHLTGYGAVGKAKGVIDLLRYALNIDVEFRLTEHPALPPFIMHITGPITAPHRDLDTGALQQYLLKNVFQGMLEDVIKGPSKIVNMLGNLF